MRIQTLQKFFIIFVLALAGIISISLKSVYAANPNLVNFQGKVVNADGTNVANASYTFRFCLYATATPTTPCTGAADNDAIWRESKSLSTTNGVFQTLLGDTTTLPNFNSNPTLYLGVNFNGDSAGEMTPRIRLASVPYALNSDALSGLTSSNFVQLAQGLQTDTSTTNASIAINKNNGSGTPNILQLQKAGADVLVINNSGLSTFSTDVDLLFAGTENLVLTNNTGSNSVDLVSLTVTNNDGASNTQRALVINNADDAANAVTDALISLTNSEGAANTVTDALVISGTAGAGLDTIIDAIDVSDDNITNGVNLGTNFLVASGDSINDFTGDTSLQVVSNGLRVKLPTATDNLSSSTSSGSGLEVITSGGSTGLTLLQGCANNEILKWNETSDVWACAADGGGAGSSTLAQAYTNGASAADQTLLLTSADGGGLIIQDAATPLGTNLFSIKEDSANGDSILFAVTTGGLTINDTSGNNGLVFDSSAHELKIYNSTASNYASITATATDATFKSNSGTTKIGNGTGAITLNAGSGAAINITGHAASVWQTDSGNLTLDAGSGAAINIGSSATSLGLNANTTITGETSGAALTVSNSTSTGNILTLNDNSTTVLSVADGGHALFQADTASQNAFGIDNIAGLSIFNVNNMTTYQLIHSPSVERSINGWVAEGTVTMTHSSTFAQTGSRSLAVDTNAANEGAHYRVPLKSGTQYSLSVWVRASAGATANLDIGYEDTADTDCAASQTFNTGAWQEYTCTFTPDANGTTSNIYIRQDDATARTIYIDSISLVEAATAITFQTSGQNLNIEQLTGNITLNRGNTGEIQPWQQNTNALLANREQAASITANGYMYVIGGYDGTNAVNTVYYAKVDADGSTSAWTAAANTLPAVRRYLTSVVANGYIYAIGGADTAGTAQSTIYYAKLNGDGTVGTWQTNPVSLPAARLGSSATVLNGLLYVAGGCTDVTCTTNAVNTIYYGKLNANGSVQGVTAPNTLTTNANNLPQNRGMGSVIVANGFLYFVGGSGSSPSSGANNTIYYGAVNSDGSIAAFSTNSINITNARKEHTSVALNGYLYIIGGFDGTNRVSTIYYARFNEDGSVNTFSTNTNALPYNRAAHTSTVLNGYVYVFGGFDGTSRHSTVYYASTARVLVGGTLDLVGLSGHTLADRGAAGAITAGNIRAIGDLRVDGYADFNNGLSVDSAFNLNAVTASIGQVVFNINNSSSNSIFSVSHMGSAFGAFAETGGFLDNNFSYSQEWATNSSETALTADSVAIGDDTSWYFDTTGTTNTYSTPDTVNGIGRFVTGTTSGVGGLIGMGNTQNNLASNILKANLPILQMKVRPSVVNATNDMFWGFMDQATAPTANDTQPANGIYFWHNNGTSWVGFVRSGSANVGTVTCTGSISTTNFAVGRIVVIDASTVDFYMDYDASNGVQLTKCGTVSGANPTAALGIAMYNIHTETTTRNIDIDYVRVMQDDNPITESSEESTAGSEEQGLPAANDIEALTPDEPTREARIGLLDFTTATSEDAVYENDVYVKGTLFADKIKANQIEGLEILTNKIASLRATAENQDPTSVQNALSSSIDLSNLQVQNLNVLLALNVSGGLKVNGLAQFNGESIFDKLVTFSSQSLFKGDTNFEGRVTLNSDSGGFAVIEKNHDRVEVKFDKPYDSAPIITVSVRNGHFVNYAYKEITNDRTKKVEGFTIILKEPAASDTEFAWTALQIKDPRTAKQPEISISN